ncbi:MULTISPECIES: hypothetical protein [unclassified Polaromonas]|jgi:hypothetical protein|uniref:hypothetical protein n=1 Tax=unclassified Polaromonas TaxID=2638319 RepID=UPI0026008289|nr:MULTISPECIES: hypothetical protein [unclassified Polaromonas]HQR97036.1 hypothetical protein [Polaromonas sp.]
MNYLLVVQVFVRIPSGQTSTQFNSLLALHFIEKAEKSHRAADFLKSTDCNSDPEPAWIKESD